MNKLLLLFVAFFLAVVAAQPRVQPQCKYTEQNIVNLAKWAEKVATGEEKNDCVGCVATLAGTIAACVADLVDWPLVVACVAGVIGTADACYPCICYVIEAIYGDIEYC